MPIERTAIGEKRGEERGEKLGEKRLSNLYKKLTEAGRMEDAQRIMLDTEYRSRLYKEFHI